MTEQPPGRKEKAAPVIRDLASKIACGTYGPGRKIPSLRKLSERYGVSVSTARRSVKALADKGMLTFLHGSGTFVAEKRSPADRRFRIAAVAATFGVNAMNTCTGIAVNGILDAADELGIELTTIPMRFEEMSDARLERCRAASTASSCSAVTTGFCRHRARSARQSDFRCTTPAAGFSR